MYEELLLKTSHTMLVRLLLVLLLILPTYVVANSSAYVEVKYISDGKLTSLHGEKTALGYIFNPDSKKILRLATLEWPPYISENECNMGWVFQLTVSILVSKGYQVQIQFLPWVRAVRSVELGEHDILFPEYYFDSTANSKNLVDTPRLTVTALSNRFDGGELRLIKRRGELDNFDGNLSKLSRKIFGVVRGYQNTPEFDLMVSKGELITVEAMNEIQLLRMLLANRVDYIVADPKVVNYMVDNSVLTQVQKKVLLDGAENVEPALQYNYLYYAISKKNKNWFDIYSDINSALANFERASEIKRIIKESESCYKGN